MGGEPRAVQSCTTLNTPPTRPHDQPHTTPSTLNSGCMSRGQSREAHAIKAHNRVEAGNLSFPFAERSPPRSCHVHPASLKVTLVIHVVYIVSPYIVFRARLACMHLLQPSCNLHMGRTPNYVLYRTVHKERRQDSAPCLIVTCTRRLRLCMRCLRCLRLCMRCRRKQHWRTASTQEDLRQNQCGTHPSRQLRRRHRCSRRCMETRVRRPKKVPW